MMAYDVLEALGFFCKQDHYREIKSNVIAGIRTYVSKFNEYVEGKISPFSSATEEDFVSLGADFYLPSSVTARPRVDRSRFTYTLLWQRMDYGNKKTLVGPIADDVDTFMRGIWSYLNGFDIESIYGALKFSPHDELFKVIAEMSDADAQKLIDWYNTRIGAEKVRDTSVRSSAKDKKSDVVCKVGSTCSIEEIQ